MSIRKFVMCFVVLSVGFLQLASAVGEKPECVYPSAWNSYVSKIDAVADELAETGKAEIEGGEITVRSGQFNPTIHKASGADNRAADEHVVTIYPPVGVKGDSVEIEFTAK